MWVVWDKYVYSWTSHRFQVGNVRQVCLYVGITQARQLVWHRYVSIYEHLTHTKQVVWQVCLCIIYMNISLTPGRLCDTGMSILYIYMNISQQAGCVRQVGLYLDIITQAGVSMSQHPLGARWVKQVVWYRCVKAVQVGLLTPLTFAWHCLSLGCFYFQCILSSQWKAVTVNLRILHCQV